MIETTIIPILNDNYTYLIKDKKTDIYALVDPADAKPLISILEKKKKHLDFILITHHHHDHVGGNCELKKKFPKCKIIGNFYDKERIPEIDITLKPGEMFFIGNSQFEVLDLPGHTIGHIGFYFKRDDSLFCGDTLFSIGCGRLFEGTADQMAKSLLEIKSLPDSTKIFCGHEYTESNANFAKKLDMKCPSLKKKILDIKQKRKNDKPTIPSLLAEEKKLNPFLKFNEKEYFKKLGFEFRSDKENFKFLRKMKDEF